VQGVTVEGLHSSFDKIDKKVETLIKKGAPDSEIECCIKKAWKEEFHMSLSVAATKGMVVHYRAVHKSAGRKTRKAMKGGMAPVDYVMGQGITDKVYGNFPVEMGTSALVSKGLDLQRFYENPAGRSCDTTGGHPAPGQKGGDIWSGFLMGHPLYSVPENAFQATVGTLQGLTPTEAGGPSSSPVASSVPRPDSLYTPYNATALSSIARIAPVYGRY